MEISGPKAQTEYLKDLLPTLKKKDLWRLVNDNEIYVAGQQEPGIDSQYLRKVLLKEYWLPLYKNLIILPARYWPEKIEIYQRIEQTLRSLLKKTLGFTSDRLPGKQYLLTLLSTLDPQNELFIQEDQVVQEEEYILKQHPLFSNMRNSVIQSVLQKQKVQKTNICKQQKFQRKTLVVAQASKFKNKQSAYFQDSFFQQSDEWIRQDNEMQSNNEDPTQPQTQTDPNQIDYKSLENRRLDQSLPRTIPKYLNENALNDKLLFKTKDELAVSTIIQTQSMNNEFAKLHLKEYSKFVKHQGLYHPQKVHQKITENRQRTGGLPFQITQQHIQ